MPDGEDVDDVDVRGPGELEAKLASSKESRAYGGRFECRCDMIFAVISFT